MSVVDSGFDYAAKIPYFVAHGLLLMLVSMVRWLRIDCVDLVVAKSRGANLRIPHSVLMSPSVVKGIALEHMIMIEFGGIARYDVCVVHDATRIVFAQFV
eukprot:103493_1